jgi:FkbM family methyltransferase
MISILLRDFGRMLGLNSLIAKLVNGPGYESIYDRQFIAHLEKGYCVWDVGANVGMYTIKFSEIVGDSGTVIAFEPSPVNFVKLFDSSANLSNVNVLNIGLGEREGRFSFIQGDDDLGATSRVLTSDYNTGNHVFIQTGDGLIARGEAMSPDAVKIDVEGFELEVLKGLSSTLNEKRLILVGVELHFGILKDRDMRSAPSLIVDLLKSSGFVVRWTDSSHIIAVRN